MGFWLTTLTEVILIASCISYLDLVHGFMGRYYFGFFAVMMCAAYAVFLAPSGHPGIAACYGLAVLLFAVTNYFALARMESQLFALFSLAQLMFAQCLTQELRTKTGGDSGLEVPMRLLATRPELRSLITLAVCAIMLFIAYKLHDSHLSKILTAYGDQSDFLQFFRPAFRNAIVAVTAFTAVSAAVLGVLLAFSFSRIDPRQYSIDEAFNISVLLIIGGRASIIGAIAAPAIILIIRATVEQRLNQPLYFGLGLQLAMIAFLLLRPNGVWGDPFYGRN